MILEVNVRGAGPWVCAIHGLEPAEPLPACGEPFYFFATQRVLQPIDFVVFVMMF
jgi:hypothetical protein